MQITLMRITLLISSLVFAAEAFAAGGGPRQNPSTFTPKQWDGYFATVGAAALGQRMAVWADLATVDAVYVADPLGEGEGATPDSGPLCDYARVDCVTYVEQVLALALAPDAASVPDTLRRIRYRDGKIDFRARNHYFVSDWLPANNWCVRDVTAEVGAGVVETMTKTISRTAFFAGKGIACDLPDEQATTQYIPRAQVGKALGKLKDGDIVIFVISTPGIIAGHVGLVRVKDRAPHVQHASLSEKRVVTSPLERYVGNIPERFVGIKVARPHQPAPPAPATEGPAHVQ
jgi:D-alanyl-D-alanine carboxypeptidase/D-alanyl-D-alanine-endopeptidase (penicillin-binding protein 4)